MGARNIGRSKIYFGRGHESRRKHVLASSKPVRVDVHSIEGFGRGVGALEEKKVLPPLLGCRSCWPVACLPLSILSITPPLLFCTFVFGGTLICLAHYSVVRFTAGQMCRVLTARFCRIPWHACGFSDNWGGGEWAAPGRTRSGADGEEAGGEGSRGENSLYDLGKF